MNGSIFLDTNILVYSRDAAKRNKQIRAAEWISHLWETRTGRLSMQVLAEYYAVVTGKLKPGMEIPSARQDVEDLFSWRPLPMTPDLIAGAWVVQDIFQFSWWDSLIVSAAKILQCAYLLSEDFQHSQDLQGLRVINPFRMRPAEL